MSSDVEISRLQARINELERQLAFRMQSGSDGEEQFRTLADSIPQLAWMADNQGWLFWYNQRWYDYTGTTFDEMQGWGWKKVHHPDHLERVIDRWRHSQETGEVWEDTFPLRSKDGEWRWFLSRAQPIRDSHGTLVRWFGTNTDITEQLESAKERARLLAETEESRALLDALVENAPVGLCFWDLKLRYTRLNQALADFNGLPIAAHLGRTPEDVVPGLKSLIPIARGVLESGEAVPYQEVSGETPAAPGVTRTCLVSLYPVHVRGVMIGIGFVLIEITDRVRAVQELNRVRERLELHLTNTPIAVLEFDERYRVTRWSPGAEKLFGWTAAEVTGKDFFSFGLVYEEDVADLIALMRDRIRGATAFFSSNRNRCKDGSVANVEWYNSIHREQGSDAVSVLAFGIDVTARTRAEESLHSHAEALARSNSELEQFAYAASHDLQEPLRMVSLYTELLRRKYQGQLGTDADLYISYAVQGARRMEGLLRDLLVYSRLIMPGLDEKVKAVDLNEVANRLLFVFDEKIRETGADITILPLPPICAHEVHVIQVLQHLLLNALTYRRPGINPQIVISASRDGSMWRVSIQDNGIGIDARYQQRVFGMFKRLQPAGHSGTGMGLAVCQKIVERYGGSIWVESDGEDKGSTFHFTLPAA